MSSYADIASQNAPAPADQPKPDPGLLEGGHTTHSVGITTEHPDVDSGKVNIVPASQDLDNIKTESSEKIKESKEWAKKQAAELESEAKEVEKKGKAAAKKAEKNLEKAYKETSKQAQDAWTRFSSDPSIWVPTLGAINVALLAGVGIFAYTRRDETRRWDRRLISAVTVGVLGLLGGQSYLATQKAREQRGQK